MLGFQWEKAPLTQPSPKSEEPTPLDSTDINLEQWQLRESAGMDVQKAWKITRGDRSEKGPLIAFLDTGVDLQHPDLKANLWTNPGEIPGNGIDDDGNGVIDDVHGYDAFFQNGNPADDSDHGTHTAGIAAAVGADDFGITGVMPEARIMPVKIFAGWLGPDEATTRGMAYARKMGATIVNHSWGGPWSKATCDAFTNFPEALHIVAAGNGGSDNDVNDFFPANLDLDNILVVAASDKAEGKLPISQFGALNVDVAAPGEDILSSIRGGGHARKSATSFATPHVTGIAGLIASVYPDLTPLQIKERILFSSDRIPQLQNVSLSGGRVNAAAALEDDRIPPGAPENFQVTRVDSNQVQVSWVVPADDGPTEGISARVEVRVSDQPITEKNYKAALPYLSSRLTEVGETDTAILTGGSSEEPRTLYFGAKAIDNVGNRSPLRTAQTTISAS